MKTQKPCIYCNHEVITDQQDGYIYAIDYEQDEMIRYAHTECMQMSDDIKIESELWPISE